MSPRAPQSARRPQSAKGAKSSKQQTHGAGEVQLAADSAAREAMLRGVSTRLIDLTTVPHSLLLCLILR